MRSNISKGICFYDVDSLSGRCAAAIIGMYQRIFDEKIKLQPMKKEDFKKDELEKIYGALLLKH